MPDGGLPPIKVLNSTVVTPSERAMVPVVSTPQAGSRADSKPSRATINIKTLMELQKKADLTSQRLKKEIEKRERQRIISRRKATRQAPSVQPPQKHVSKLSVRYLPAAVLHNLQAGSVFSGRKSVLVTSQSLRPEDFKAVATTPKAVQEPPHPVKPAIKEVKWKPAVASSGKKPHSVRDDMEHWHSMNTKIDEILSKDEVRVDPSEKEYQSVNPPTTRQMIKQIKLSRPKYLKKINPRKQKVKPQPQLKPYAPPVVLPVS